jgi:hypothetical protein
MKHFKLALSLLALALVPVVLMATTEEKKSEGMMEKAAEKVKHAMGMGTEDDAYEKGREAVKQTKISAIKEKVDSLVAAGKSTYEETAERGHGIKERFQDMLHMGKDKAAEVSDEVSHQARKATDNAQAAAARGHGVFETIKGTARRTLADGEETLEQAATKAGDLGGAAKEKAAEAAAYARGVRDEVEAEATQGLPSHEEQGLMGKVKEALHMGTNEKKGVVEEIKEKVEQVKEKAAEL